MMTRSAICFVLALMLVADKAQGASVDDNAWAAKLVNQSNAKCSWFGASDCSNIPDLDMACPVACDACNWGAGILEAERVDKLCPGDSYLWRYPEETSEETDACTSKDGGECWSDDTELCGPAYTTDSKKRNGEDCANNQDCISGQCVTTIPDLTTKCLGPPRKSCTIDWPCADGEWFDCDTNDECETGLVCVADKNTGKLSGGGYDDYCRSADAEDKIEINHARMVKRCGKRKSEKKCRKTKGCKWDATVPNCFAEVEDVCPGDSYLWRFSEETDSPSDGCTDEDGGECYSDATESCGEKSYECSGDPASHYLWRYPEETDDKSDACTAADGGECWREGEDRGGGEEEGECYSASKLDKSCVGNSYLWRFPEETTDAIGDDMACTVNEDGGECWNEDTSECEPVSAEVGASGTAKGCFKTWKAGYDGCNTAVTESDCKSLHESCAWLFNEPIKVFFDRLTRIHGCSGDPGTNHTYELWRYPEETEDEDDACTAADGGECWSDDTEECKPALTLFGKYAAEGKKWHAKKPLTRKEIKRFAREAKARFKLYKKDYYHQINKPTKQDQQAHFNIKRLYKAAKQSLAALKKAAQ